MQELQQQGAGLRELQQPGKELRELQKRGLQELQQRGMRELRVQRRGEGAVLMGLRELQQRGCVSYNSRGRDCGDNNSGGGRGRSAGVTAGGCGSYNSRDKEVGKLQKHECRIYKSGESLQSV